MKGFIHLSDWWSDERISLFTPFTSRHQRVCYESQTCSTPTHEPISQTVAILIALYIGFWLPCSVCASSEWKLSIELISSRHEEKTCIKKRRWDHEIFRDLMSWFLFLHIISRPKQWLVSDGIDLMPCKYVSSLLSLSFPSKTFVSLTTSDSWR